LGIYTLRDSNEVLRNVPLFGFGGSFKASKQASLYTNFTQNYRAINFTDIRISNPNIIIDSAIRDEYGYTGELGFRGLVNTWMIFDLAAFYVFYGDKIGLAPKPGTILKERTNIGDARNMGLELFTEVDFLKITKHDNEKGLSLFLNAAYINAVYIRSKESNYVNKQVEYVSPVIVKSGLRFKTKALTLQVQGSYNSSQYADATNAVEPSGDAVIGLVPSYYVFDFSGRYHLNRSISFELGVNNFTNEQYFTRRAPGYPGPGILPSDGISFYGTFQYQFRTK
jgi:Fe(3+) dicitrate transport protein